MQIIINRIAIICETQNIVTKLKWGTAIVMTAINIAVFCIVSGHLADQPWVPEQLVLTIATISLSQRIEFLL